MEIKKAKKSPEKHFVISGEELFKKYYDTVFHLSLARVSDKTCAEDILQEVFLRAIKSKPVFNSEEHCKAWLIKVTINCSKSYLRSAHLRHRATLDENMAQAPQKDDNTILLEAVNSLPPIYRTVVHLYYYEDMKTEEIAKALRLSQSAVKQRLRRARQELKSFMTGDDF